MPHAEIDANGWTLIIGAVFLGLTKLWSMWLDYRRDQARIARDVATAAKVDEVRRQAGQTASRVEQVKDTLADSQTLTTQALQEVQVQIEAVHKATNSLTERLVETTGQKAHAEGFRAGEQSAAAAPGPCPLTTLAEQGRLEEQIAAFARFLHEQETKKQQGKADAP